MAVFKLSPSSIGLMKDCPRCFWLDKHRVWKRPSGPFPSLPSGMDRVLKVHFDNFRDKGLIPPELCENQTCEGMKLFEDKALLEKWRNNFDGVRWVDSNGDVLFGAVDEILVKGEKLIVLDYKTRGYPVKENTPEYYQSQLDLYNFLLRKNGYETEDYALLLFYVPKEVLEKGEVVFDTELVKVGVNVENAEKLFNQALTVLNGECPSERCEWCAGLQNKK